MQKLSPRNKVLRDYMQSNMGRTLTREELCEATGRNPDESHHLLSRSIDVAVSRVRKALPDGQKIENVLGIGYILKEVAST